MRIFLKSILAMLPLAFFASNPAHAAAEAWRQSCTGADYVCGGGEVAKSKKAVASKPVNKVAKIKAKQPVEVSSDDAPEKATVKKKTASVKKPSVKVADTPVKAKAKKVAKVETDDDADQPKAKSKSKAAKSGGGSEYQSGMASWYGGNFHGRKTANGETYDMNEMTAAHKTLPFGTRVRVTNTRNGDYVDVRINDRGPFVGGRIIDLSRAAASDIGLMNSGVTHVKVAILGKG
jgi:rare lipoprotein A